MSPGSNPLWLMHRSRTSRLQAIEPRCPAELEHWTVDATAIVERIVDAIIGGHHEKYFLVNRSYYVLRRRTR